MSVVSVFINPNSDDDERVAFPMPNRVSIPRRSERFQLFTGRNRTAVQPNFPQNSGFLPELKNPVRRRDNLVVIVGGVEQDPRKTFRIARISGIVGFFRIVDLFDERIAAVTRGRDPGLDRVLTGLCQRRPTIWRTKSAIYAAPDPDPGEITRIELFPIHID